MPDLSLTDPRNLLLARKAKKYGMQNSLRTVVEAKRAGIPVSLGFALVEQESGNGANVFGHDKVRNPIKSPPGGLLTVTESRYRSYKHYRQQGLGMQGVGPLQLTWYTIQDAADHRGGCWVPRHNLAQGFQTLASLIKEHGLREGVRRYNGSGPAADAYAHSVLKRQAKWHQRLS